MIKSYNYKDFKIEILYEDSYIAILNKPSGLLTHKKNELDNTPNLQESLLDHFTIDDDENLKDNFNNKFKTKENLFLDFKIILFILLLSIFPKYFFPISFVIKRILFGSFIRLKLFINASAGKI